MARAAPPRPDAGRFGPVGQPFPILVVGRDRGGMLVAVIAVLAFLAGLAAGAATLLATESARWRASLVAEATVQVRPVRGRDPDADLARAASLARDTPGIEGVDVLPLLASERLLEPWLGRGFDLRDLPVPRLLVLRFGRARPDLTGLAVRLRAELPTASLDDHGAWLSRLSRATAGLVGTAVGAVLLILAASAGAIAFATRGVVVGHRDVMEVLHFVGASRGFVARLFARRFAQQAGIGGLIGSVASAVTVTVATRTVGFDGDGGATAGLGLPHPWILLALAVIPLADAAIAGLVAAIQVRRIVPGAR